MTFLDRMFEVEMKTECTNVRKGTASWIEDIYLFLAFAIFI